MEIKLDFSSSRFYKHNVVKSKKEAATLFPSGPAAFLCLGGSCDISHLFMFFPNERMPLCTAIDSLDFLILLVLRDKHFGTYWRVINCVEH